MCMYMYKYRNTRFICRALFGISRVYAAMQSPWFHCLVVSFQTPPFYNGGGGGRGMVLHSSLLTENVMLSTENKNLAISLPCAYSSVPPFCWATLVGGVWGQDYNLHWNFRHMFIEQTDQIAAVLWVGINTRGMKTDIAGASTVMHRITGYRDSVTHVHT